MLDAALVEGDAIRALALGDFATARMLLLGALELGEASREHRLNLAIAEDRAGDPARARRMLEELAATWPAWDEPVLRLAEQHRWAGRLASAAADYHAVLVLNPNRHEALLGLAVMHLKLGAVSPALPLLMRACAGRPEDAEAWDAYGTALMYAADPPAAEAAFARAQTLAHDDVGIAIRRAEAANAAGSSADALAAMTLSSERDPVNVALLAGRAVLLRALGAVEDAIGLLEAAAALAPGCGLVLRLFGEALMSAHRARAAEAVLAEAVRLAPDDAGLANNHAAALIRLQRYRPARDALRTLVSAHGEATGVLSNLANALVSLGQQGEGLAVAKRGVELDPASHLAARALANAVAYHPRVTGASLLAANARAGALLDRSARLAPAPTRTASRLRVGVLSATLKTHPVGWLSVAGFEALDPAAFEIHCFAQGPSEDTIQRRFAAIATAWHNVAGQPPKKVAETIRASGIDVLIDMGGYGDLGMLPACALRPAPVQVKWIGAQSHSTGLAEMDWFITDRWETPEGFERFYSERLWRMPDGYVCYSPPAYAPEVAPAPALRNGMVTFGCFNNLAKVTPEVIDTWATILRAVPAARLVLKCHQFNDAETVAAIAEAFKSSGIAHDRLELRGSSHHRALLAEYADIDIVLDPFPYTGGLTTCEALWMGVPTICLAGETFSARHSTSHMSNVGLADWSADDVPGYIRLALDRAGDIPALAALRAGLRGRVADSPLCDARRFGENLGAALQAMWQARPTSR